MSSNDLPVENRLARRLRRRLVGELVDKGVLRSAEWIEAFGDVPRHLFVPGFHQRLPSGRFGAQILGDEPHQRGVWIEAVYSDDTLVTRHNGADSPEPIVSSSAPSLMAVMLEALDLTDGMRVLEIGTGTGYNAALLCRRLGSDCVTSIDIAADLVELAGLRLAALGFTPRAVVADGAAGYPPDAPYDRILATCGVARIPAAWLEQTRRGGIIVANMGLWLARLTVDDSGWAHGRFLRETGAFMHMRSPTDSRQMSFRDAVALVQSEGDAIHRASLPKAADDETVTALTDLAMPQVLCFELDKPTGASRCLVDLGACSWARADVDGGQATIHQSGSRRLWDEVEGLYALWDRAGRPRHDELGLTVEPRGRHHLWAGEPTNVITALAGPSYPS